jgi:hypothetical protein
MAKRDVAGVYIPCDGIYHFILTMQIACITKVITITDSEWSKVLQQTWPTSLKLINSL